MGKKEKGAGGFELSRRDFLKVSAAGAAAAGTLGLTPAPAMAVTNVGETTYERVSTCPYCSAQCGQIVVVGEDTGTVYDIYGDKNSPTNRGGLCAKGAGGYQLVNNKRRIGVPFNNTGMTGTAWWRNGDGPWNEIALATAMTEIAGGCTVAGRLHDGLVQIRNDGAGWNTGDGGTYADGDNAQAVQFFGCSHMNNEQNWSYRKLIAQFGTSRTEHQARI